MRTHWVIALATTLFFVASTSSLSSFGSQGILDWISLFGLEGRPAPARLSARASGGCSVWLATMAQDG